MRDKPYSSDCESAGSSPVTTQQGLPDINQPFKNSVAAREMTAREVLYSRIDDLQRDLAELTELAKALPQELPYRADRALRTLLLNQK